MQNNLPIHACLPELLTTLQAHSNTVLSAPPGAGKTTQVPLALLQLIPPQAGKIIMLEPRRIAAASAARYMAESLGEAVGQTVGYSIRFERKVTKATRVEVVTEGILTRRLQEDPELKGVACVIFDEFHERSIHADLGLALCLESQAALRPDLKLLVMSATLDCQSIAALLGNAPVVSAEGRMFPVAIRYLEGDARLPLVQRMSRAIKQALADEPGDLLAFLPGSGEIKAVARELEGLSKVVICPLYGELPFVEQQRAVLPGPQRRVVLATNIAETSLTIDGVRIVVDSGLSRRLQLDPASGLEQLVTVRASQASAQQRSGRAGRTAPGVCYRLYSQQSFTAMTPFSPPEILTADLAPLLLELTAWGCSDVQQLAWLDQPPAAHLTTARTLLQLLGALDNGVTITALGRRMVRLPLHPRLARLLVAAEAQGRQAEACCLAAELSHRSSARAAIKQTEQQLLSLMQRYAHDVAPAAAPDPLLSPYLAAWPDRLAQQRAKEPQRYLLASGQGARLAEGLAPTELLVALQLSSGTSAEGVIRQAISCTAAEVRDTLPHLLTQQRQIWWDAAAERVMAAEQEQLGAVVLASRQVKASDDEAWPLVQEQLQRKGLDLLAWSEASLQLQARVLLASTCMPEEAWPDLSVTGLLASLEQWLLPHAAGLRSLQELARLDMVQVVQELVGWKLLQLLDKELPVTITVPSGRRISLDYRDPDGPVLAVKLQELFGLAVSPLVCRGRRPVLVHLLSPAGRPVAVTRDLQGFWQRGYLEVRKELRGRYPKHPWPDDPWQAKATHKTKKALER